MPVTPAHAAVVVPLARVLPALPLAVGTQVPDLPMIFPALMPSYAITHDYLRGIPVDVAYGVLFWLLCEWIRPAAIALLPWSLRCRLAPLALSRFAISLRTIVALAVGAASHLVWDEFTHEARWGARHFASLRAVVYGLPGYHWLQYGTGLLGLAFLALWTLRKLRGLPRGEDVARHWRPAERHGVLVTLLVLLPVASLARAGLQSDNAHDFAFIALTTLMANELLALTAARAWFGARA